MPLKLKKKKNGIFHLSGTVNGHRCRESTHTTSREHAETIRRQTERDLEDRAFLRVATFADAVNVYLEKRPDAGAHLGPLMDRFETVQLKDITPSAVSAFSTERYGHMEPSSVKRYLYTPLNAVLRQAHEAQLCPLMRFAPPKVKRKPVVYANDQWLRTFLEHAHARIALTVLFITLTGTRVSEACRVALGDLDLARGAAILRYTKPGKSRRVILPGSLADALTFWIAEQKLEEPSTPVFGYAARWSVNQAIERVCDKINLEAGAVRFVKIKDETTGKVRKVREEIGPLAIAYLSSHQVGRHAFAARLLAEGKGLKFVQEAGGWAGIQIVAEAYGHLEQSAIDSAMRESGDAMFTKMGSATALLAKQEIAGQEIGNTDDPDILLEAMKRRHALEKSGDWVVGATGIEPVTPTMSRLTTPTVDGAKSHKNRPSASGMNEGTGGVHDGNVS